MRLYATAAAYETYHGLAVGEAPANVDTLLRTASQLVDVLLRGHVYDTDTDGYPTDADHLTAVSDAACAIAGELDSTGALESGSTVEWDQVKIGSVSLGSRKTADAATTVAGLPVPSQALLHLAGVGRRVVLS